VSKIVEDYGEGFAVNRYGSDIVVDLCYPRLNPVKAVQVGLSDVRAADNVRLWYDFERDGWVVEQASTFEWDGDDAVCDPDWQEVAFVPAWGRERKPEAPNDR
jgi:hypothetical protein